MENATVLIIGVGGREHALALMYLKSDNVKKVVIAPGNDFIPYSLKDRYPDKNIIIDSSCNLKNLNSLNQMALKYNPDLVDVAQDDALALGLVNNLEDLGYSVFGPTKEASKIEADKIWSRNFIERHNIPSPFFECFDNVDNAREYVKNIYLETTDALLYVKASGLCAGKGAIRAETLDGAYTAIRQMESLGDAGKSFVIEEGIVGEEFSVFAICDGDSYRIINTAQDNKTLFDGDLGPNTGGMGCHAPALVTSGLMESIEEKLIAPVIKGMAEEGVPFRGILYLGGMLTKDGLKVIEYNARWGDPEAQTILPGLQCDYYELVQACIGGNLVDFDLKVDDKTRVCVVGAAKGYPDSPIKGCEIIGLDDVMKMEGIEVFGAGIVMEGNTAKTSGGRVFNIVGGGENIIGARKNAYDAINSITVEGENLHFRTDIGIRDEKRLI